MGPEQPTIEEVTETSEMEDYVEPRQHRINFMLKKVQSTHVKLTDNVKINKTTKSAHLLGDTQRNDALDTVSYTNANVSNSLLQLVS